MDHWIMDHLVLVQVLVPSLELLGRLDEIGAVNVEQVLSNMSGMDMEVDLLRDNPRVGNVNQITFAPAGNAPAGEHFIGIKYQSQTFLFSATLDPVDLKCFATLSTKIGNVATSVCMDSVRVQILIVVSITESMLRNGRLKTITIPLPVWAEPHSGIGYVFVVIPTKRKSRGGHSLQSIPL